MVCSIYGLIFIIKLKSSDERIFSDFVLNKFSNSGLIFQIKLSYSLTDEIEEGETKLSLIYSLFVFTFIVSQVKLSFVKLK